MPSSGSPVPVDTGAAQSTLDSAVARDLGLRVTGSFRLAGVTGATGTSTAFMSGRRLNDIGLPQTNVVLTRPMPRVDPPAGAGRELTGA